MKSLPKWSRFLIAAGILLILLALLLPYLLDVDRYRPQIVAALEEETGRPVHIEAIRARFLPSIGFTIQGFRLGNPPTFPEGALVSAEMVRGNLAWGPLFRREFQVSSVEVIRPQVTLLEDDRGRTNYDLKSSSSGAATSPGETSFRIAGIPSIRLSDARLVLGRVAGRSKTVAQVLQASNISADLTDVAFEARSLKRWKANANLAGVRLELTALRQPIEFQSGHFLMEGGQVQSYFVADLSGASSVKGTLRIPDIEDARPRFEVNTALLDLDKLLAVTQPSDSAPSARTPRSGQRELLADGRFGADKIRWSSLEATDATATIRIYGDRLEISPARATLYDGTLSLSVTVDQRQEPSQFAADAHLNGLTVEKLLATQPSTKGKMTGTAESTLQLKGVFGPDLQKALSGSGTVAIRNGKFPGIDLGKNLLLVQRIQSALNLRASEGPIGETTFKILQADLIIQNRSVASRQIRLESSAGIVELRGSLSFDGTLNYDGQADLVADTASGSENLANLLTGVLGRVMKQDVSRVVVSFALRGTLENPKIQPGRALPRIQTATESNTQDQTKKKSILDLFRKP